MTPYTAEFLGALLLILLGNGVVANVLLPRTKGHGGGWIVIAFGWGMAVFVAVSCVEAASGAQLNPAVTIGLVAAGKFAAAKAPGYIAAQMLGAMTGAALVLLVYRDHFRAGDDPAAKLACFATAPAIRRASSNVVSEVVGTFVLVLAVLLAATPTVGPADDLDGKFVGGTLRVGVFADGALKIGLGSLGALPVGLVVLAIGLSLGGTTGYAINPARDLGPRLVHALLPVPGKGGSDWSYAWIPVVGPILGALLAASAFAALQSAAG